MLPPTVWVCIFLNVLFLEWGATWQQPLSPLWRKLFGTVSKKKDLRVMIWWYVPRYIEFSQSCRHDWWRAHCHLGPTTIRDAGRQQQRWLLHHAPGCCRCELLLQTHWWMVHSVTLYEWAMGQRAFYIPGAENLGLISNSSAVTRPSRQQCSNTITFLNTDCPGYSWLLRACLCPVCPSGVLQHGMKCDHLSSATSQEFKMSEKLTRA